MRSHLVFEEKKDKDKTMKMKTRLVLHGNRDRNRYSVRQDPASADLLIVRIVISFTTILRLTLVTADVRGVYMQSRPIQTDLDVRPPKRIDLRRQTVWKLFHFSYGIVEAGRQWLCVIENWLPKTYKAERSVGVDQLFHKMAEDSKINIVAKVVDDLLTSGNEKDVSNFLERFNERFKLGKIDDGSKLKVLGCDLAVTDKRDIQMSMSGYLDRIQITNVTKSRCLDKLDKADETETHAFRSLSGTLLFLGQAVLSQACLDASKMQLVPFVYRTYFKPTVWSANCFALRR